MPVHANAETTRASTDRLNALAGDFATAGVFLDSAYQHPVSRAVRHAIDDYFDNRMAGDTAVDAAMSQRDAIIRFAALINASKDEVCFVPGATTAENLLVAALGLMNGGRVVTDELHYDGSLYLYETLRRRGVEVTILRSRDGMIDPRDVQRALSSGADLLAVSWVSANNGFRHDLAEISAIAHRYQVPVYADIIQGVGAVPLDVRACGVDFCGTSSYKWLMADLGLGFLYVRQDRLDMLRPVQAGLRQLAETHTASLERRPGAAGVFETASVSNVIVAALNVSLANLLSVDVALLEARRLPLIDHAQEALGACGLRCTTPATARGPLVTFALPEARRLREPLAAAGVYVTCYEDHIRVAPSVFNTHDDIDALCRVVHEHTRCSRPTLTGVSA